MNNLPPSADRHERVMHHVKRVHAAAHRLRESHTERAAHEAAERAQRAADQLAAAETPA